MIDDKRSVLIHLPTHSYYCNRKTMNVCLHCAFVPDCHWALQICICANRAGPERSLFTFTSYCCVRKPSSESIHDDESVPRVPDCSLIIVGPVFRKVQQRAETQTCMPNVARFTGLSLILSFFCAEIDNNGRSGQSVPDRACSHGQCDAQLLSLPKGTSVTRYYCCFHYHYYYLTCSPRYVA